MRNLDPNLELILYPGESIKLIRNFGDYLVTDIGRVISAKKKVQTKTLNGIVYEAIIYKELKPSVVRGYKTVNLTGKGKQRKKLYVHELVFEAFYEGVFDRYFFKINHLNGDKLDNRLSNLRLDFRKKDKSFLEKYNKKMRFNKLLNDYSSASLNDY